MHRWKWIERESTSDIKHYAWCDIIVVLTIYTMTRARIIFKWHDDLMHTRRIQTTDTANSFKENLHICHIFVNFLFCFRSLYFFCHPFWYWWHFWICACHCWCHTFEMCSFYFAIGLSHMGCLPVCSHVSSWKYSIAPTVETTHFSIYENNYFRHVTKRVVNIPNNLDLLADNHLK